MAPRNQTGHDVPVTDLEQRLRDELSRSDRPLTAKELVGLIDDRTTDAKAIAASLQQLDDRGDVVAWASGRYAAKSAEDWLPTLIRPVLRDEPKTRNEISEGLPPAFRVDAPALLRVLRSLVEQGELFATDPKRVSQGNDRGVRFSLDDPRVALRAAVEAELGDEPTAVAKLVKAIAPKPLKKHVEEVLKELAAEGHAFQWKGDAFANRDPAETLKVELSDVLADAPLPEKQLIAATPSAKRLGQKELRSALKRLVSAKAFHRFRAGRSTVYGTRRQMIGVALADLEHRYGLTREDLRQELLGAPSEATPEPSASTPGQNVDLTPPEADAETTLLTELRRLANERDQRTTTLAELRTVSALAGEVLDRALLRLMRQGVVDLYEHDYPAGLSPEARRKLVVDEHDRYFNAVVLKEES